MLFAQNATQQHRQHLQQQNHKQQDDNFTAPQAVDFYLDDYHGSLSLSSSPISTHLSPSVVSAVGFPASAPSFDERDTVLAADFDSELVFDTQDYDFSMLGGSDLNMQAESWLPHSQLSAGRQFGGRVSHHRESSLSSLGSTSAEPASPFSQNTSNPHIAVTDPTGDGYPNMAPYYEDPSLQPTKSLMAGPQPPAPGAGNHDGFYGNGHAATFASPRDLPMQQYGGMLAANRQKSGFLPPPDLGMGSNRSQPVSVASSIASNSPATPSLDQPDEETRRRNVAFSKLDRTMADAYTNDDLYNSNFGIPTSAPTASSTSTTAQGQDIFGQRLQAINKQHLRHTTSLVGASRERSPFRHGSPLAPTATQAGQDFASHGGLRFGSIQQPQQQQPRQPRQLPQQQAQQRVGAGLEQTFRPQMASTGHSTSTPQTISPKDAVLDYHEVETETDASNFSLFTQNAPQGFGGVMRKPTVSQMGNSYPSITAPSFSFMPQVATGLQQMQPQYPFATQYRTSQATATKALAGGAMMPAAMQPNPERPTPETTSTSIGIQRPLGVAADGGTYTCTYHGCTLRFETPALLQKHKREGHRQANAMVGVRRADGQIPATLQNSQAGPHRCERVNPSTGKPCNTVFSRPYDLTRHEDTIHNARKQKVRCGLCTEEKTFSRADALTRHFRVCHPEVELRGKQRKRATHSM